jgi:hypothetical protein
MKYILSFFFVLLAAYANCQVLVHYQDTVNNFVIGIPGGWRYFTAKTKTDLPLKVLRAANASDKNDKAFENFNINIIDQPGANIAISYKRLVSALSSTNNFKLIAEGEITTGTETFKWLKETHKNDLMANQDLINYVFITWKNGKTYVLTFVTIPQNFEKYEALFLQIAKTFAVSTGKGEDLVINWPEDNKFKVIADQEDSIARTQQWLPANETVANWTIVVSIFTIKNVHAPNLDLIIKSYTDASVKESSAAKYEILEKKDAPGEMYAILKVETPYFPNDPHPESQLYYFIPGENAFFTCMVAVKQAKLSAEFVSKWSQVLKNSKLTRE